VSPRFLADENIDPDLVLGLRRRIEDIDILRVQDVGLRTLDDPEILQWAADEGRILISHDLKTMPGFAGERLTAGLPMPGIILLRSTLSIAQALDEIAAIAGASDADEWTDQIAYLPLR
jgi:predicted nuclease of predicted toxin-antitoxin system